MSSMMQMLGMFLPDSVKQSMKLDNILATDMTQYKKIPGIANAKISSEAADSYTVSYDFANVKALNQALAMATDEKNMLTDLGNLMKTQYAFKKGKLSRRTTIDPSGLEELEGINLEESKEMFQFMNSPTYTVTYKLPKKVKKMDIKNEKSVAVKDSNAVTISYNLFDFLNSKGEMMHHDIKF